MSYPLLFFYFCLDEILARLREHRQEHRVDIWRVSSIRRRCPHVEDIHQVHPTTIRSGHHPESIIYLYIIHKRGSSTAYLKSAMTKMRTHATIYIHSSGQIYMQLIAFIKTQTVQT